MKVLITGSHFTPAKAVIEKLLEIPNTEIVYLGRKLARDDDNALSVESKILPGLGVKFIPITAGKLNRFLSLGTVISFLKTPVGFIQSFYHILKVQPDLIVSFGGFTGLPVVVSGWCLSIPSLVHEQGLKMGLSNLISGFFANKIAVSFEDFKKPKLLNPEKFIVTGNPVRKEFLQPQVANSKDIGDFVKSKSAKPLILVTAGNQGSHKINLLVEDTLEQLTEFAQLIHQTGDSKYDDFSNLKKHESNSYLVKKWIDSPDLSFSSDKADLVISRAGINTLIELALKSTPALMVPISIGTEQKNNAKYFANIGLGETIEEEKLTPKIFLDKIKEMLSKKEKLKKSAETVKKNIILHGEQRLVQEILIIENGLRNPGLNFK